MARALTGGVVLLAHHVDALELSCAVMQVPPALAGRPDELECALDNDRRRAGASVPPRPLPSSLGTWAGLPVVGHPRGKRPGKPYCLETDDWITFIANDRAPGPRLVVQLRSDYLLRHGPLAACKEVTAWIETHLLSLLDLVDDETPVWRVARIDLAADVSGLSLAPGDLARFTTPARSRRVFHVEPDDVGTPVTEHFAGRALSGYTFGRRGSPVHARVYDKTRESKADAPVRDVWRAAGYEQGADGKQVWRVEFEVRSSLIRTLAAAEGHLPSAPEKLLALHLDELWRHLMTEWLVFHSPHSTRVERAAVAGWWQALSSVRGLDGAAFGPVRGLTRRTREQHDTTVLLKQAVGLLAAAAAANGGSSSLEDSLDCFASFARAREGETGFARRVHRSRSRYRTQAVRVSARRDGD